MASIHRSIMIDKPMGDVWDALRDVGALHTRLVVGFVTNCKLEGRTREVTFANGMKAKETIIDVDEQRRRVAWTATGGQLTHYNASAQVFQVTDLSCEVRWIADLLPDEMAKGIDVMIQQGLAAMKRTLEAA
jgi:polyketide cyclase/dehydrase/lipid transport protein